MTIATHAPLLLTVLFTVLAPNLAPALLSLLTLVGLTDGFTRAPYWR